MTRADQLIKEAIDLLCTSVEIASPNTLPNKIGHAILVLGIMPELSYEDFLRLRLLAVLSGRVEAVGTDGLKVPRPAESILSDLDIAICVEVSQANRERN